MPLPPALSTWLEEQPAVEIGCAALPLALLPAYPALAWALVARRPRLVTLAAAGAVAHAWLTWPMRPRRAAGERAAAEPAAAGRLRIVSANVLLVNDQAGRLAGWLKEQAPDIVVVCEYSSITARALAASGALDDHPYRCERISEGSRGIVVASREPFEHVRLRFLGGLPAVDAVVRFGRQHELRLLAVHLSLPTQRRWAARWRGQLAQLERWVAEDDRPVAVVGDFNAVWTMPPFRRLLRGADLVDAADALGHGWLGTWPARRRWHMPLTRPDHLLAGHAAQPIRHRRGPRIGSDHLPIVVDLVHTLDQPGRE